MARTPGVSTPVKLGAKWRIDLDAFAAVDFDQLDDVIGGALIQRERRGVCNFGWLFFGGRHPGIPGHEFQHVRFKLFGQGAFAVFAEHSVALDKRDRPRQGHVFPAGQAGGHQIKSAQV